MNENLKGGTEHQRWVWGRSEVIEPGTECEGSSGVFFHQLSPLVYVYEHSCLLLCRRLPVRGLGKVPELVLPMS